MILRPSRASTEPRHTQRLAGSALCGAHILHARRTYHECGCAGSGTAKGWGGQSSGHGW